MKILGVLVIFIIYACELVVTDAGLKREKFSTFERDVESVVAETFVTQIDHFRPQDSRTVPMQYHANLNHYLPNGPIYIFIKHVTDSSTQWIEQGLMLDIAPTNLAALYTFDQRFFGSNLMFDEFTWENLRYLTVEQTIADIAAFIEHVRRSLNTPFAPVILWGSQFGATLATWTRLKYPHLVRGVWSSSGIFQIQYQTTGIDKVFVVTPLSYYNLIDYTLRQSSTACRYRVSDAFQEIEEMIASGQNGQLQNVLDLCDPVNTNSTYDVAMVLERLIDIITSHIDQFHFHGVQNFCHDISTTSSSPLESIIRWAQFVHQSENDCFDFGYNRTVERYTNTRLPRLAWHYLQCTQVGNFRVTDSYNWLSRRISFGYHLSLCKDMLGDEYDSINFMNSMAELELQFGGYYQDVTNIIYTNGFIDPWLYDGIVSSGAVNATVFNIDYYSRSADLTSLNGWDSYDLTLAKRAIRNIINDWSRV